jgi:hypothetical protein
MAIPFKPMPRLAAERWERVRCVASNPSHPENYLAGALLDLLEGLHDKATLAPANDVPAPSKVTPEDVELRVGQTWLTRDGSKVKLVYLDHSDDVFPFKGDNNCWYTKKGRFYTATRTAPMTTAFRSLHDLVELVSDVEQAPNPDAAPSGSLVERVAVLITSATTSRGAAEDVLREVAAAALQMPPDKNLTMERVALWLEREANNG